ncbi:malonyl-ACP O-methyltransferase BioC [Gilvimarinus sp. SDUM040013]|uniref:Malonyl-[acyl-carrier protein] O-methyltransferase n=1 Tax=Gilvimarinus gilvus TaxID=3058038 RepID=A0ABU4RTW7_9GAMM|nr:malonyl-ACP O-methyltransferase BioC [Gilvimarinus sp. SDUM040013]MDO3386744.1 malonyl-ACP O-methyltransferase BioC [Gilvimarinus sp. SDUM040013]MDX6848326.1 malonyl-ACP O-methyltransferase BioC [Gilvimarinus sp. SDUM040013]
MSNPEIYKSTSPTQSEPIVLLHGWGFDRSSMEPLIEPLRQLADVWNVNLPGFGGESPERESDLEAWLEFLAQSLPASAALVGWSLGGMLALAYSQKYPARVSAIATLACNAKFVAAPDWPRAMDRQVNRLFNRGFDAEPATTLKRFCGLVAQGANDERARLRHLRGLVQLPDSTCMASWSQGLSILSQADFRQTLQRTRIPCLHLLAAEDALVPAQVLDDMRGLNASHQVEVISGAGHALHWDQTGQVLSALNNFLRPVVGNHLDKRWVAKSFSRAAASYDSAARLQRRVGQSLLEGLAPTSGTVVDLGSGTGHFLNDLKRGNPEANLLALDLAEGMLLHAREQQRPADAWLCADAEALPFTSGSIAAFYSSLAIQWCEDQGCLFSELLRSLRPGGQLCLSTLTDGTLAELAKAWQAVDKYIHVNRFVAADVVVQALKSAGFIDIEIRQETVLLHCASLRELSSELKALGAHNVNTGRPKGLTGRERLSRLEAAYEAERTDQGLPVTYQVCYVSASKPT